MREIRRQVNSFHRKSDLCVWGGARIVKWMNPQPGFTQAHTHTYISFPTIRKGNIFWFIGEATAYQNKKNRAFKTVSLEINSVWVSYITMVFLISSMTLLLKQCCTS